MAIAEEEIAVTTTTTKEVRGVVEEETPDPKLEDNMTLMALQVQKETRGVAGITTCAAGGEVEEDIINVAGEGEEGVEEATEIIEIAKRKKVTVKMLERRCFLLV